MPKIYERMKSVAGKLVVGVNNLSLTTDIWSTEFNSMSLLSLTAHWLTTNFERQAVVLNVVQLIWFPHG